MTGRARGYCMLKVPKAPEEPMVGIAGIEGRPVTVESCSPGERALAHLRQQAAYIENALNFIRNRICHLEAVRVLGKSGS